MRMFFDVPGRQAMHTRHCAPFPFLTHRRATTHGPHMATQCNLKGNPTQQTASNDAPSVHTQGSLITETRGAHASADWWPRERPPTGTIIAWSLVCLPTVRRSFFFVVPRTAHAVGPLSNFGRNISRLLSTFKFCVETSLDESL